MSRRHKAEKREIFPDPKYRDEVVSKFMNNLMVDGKKSVAERIVINSSGSVSSNVTLFWQLFESKICTV